MQDNKPTKSNIWVVIPCFNESQTINSVVMSIYHVLPNIVVVNDASTDQTLSNLVKLPVTTLTNTYNLGYVESIQIGLNYAFDHGASYVITFDADGQHLAIDLQQFISAIKMSKPDLILGKRSFKNRFIEKVFSLYTRRSLGISDPFCGFKSYSHEFYLRIGGKLEYHYTIGLESLFKQVKFAHPKIVEVDLTTINRQDESRFAGRIRGNLLELYAAGNLIWFLHASR